MLRHRLAVDARHALPSVVRYTVLLVGLLATVQTVGIDLTTFNVMAGALGVGVGFGLQSVVSNFIAGLIMMFEWPVKRRPHRGGGGVAAKVWLRGLGDHGVLFELLVWTSSMVDHKGRLLCQLHYAIDERFNAGGIEFPFPQRDPHITDSVLKIWRAPPSPET